MKKLLKYLRTPLIAAVTAITFAAGLAYGVGGWTDDGAGNFYLEIKGRKVLKVTQTATGTTLTAVGSTDQALVLAGSGSGTVSGVTTASVIGTALGVPYFAATTGALTSTAALTDGQIVVGVTGSIPTVTASPAVTAITAPTITNATLLNGAGTATVKGYLREVLVHTTGNLTLTAAMCGRVVVNNATTGAQTFTLPAVASAGCAFQFITGHADGETLVNMAASGTCVITTFAAVGADADTAIVADASCDTGLKNTAATNAIGDSLQLVSDGTRWLGVGITSGIWASQ